MVKLDVSLLRFLDDEDFRVLTGLEMAMRNHDVAPTALIERIAQLPHGGCRKRLQTLLKHKMIHHENTMYDGYAMKYGAYDYLALRTLARRGSLAAVAHRIGCGKESDIILVQDTAGRECVLKLQRLGRCSFRTVSRNRDYKGGGRARRGESWFYLSRLAAAKEFAYMRALYDAGLPVPTPIDHNRHALLMSLVPGTTLNNITTLGDPQKVYTRCLNLMVSLAEYGLVHGDFNEFNLMITEEMRVMVIDFPQMVSINHPNAAELFRRDVENLAKFFHRRFKLTTLLYPSLEKDVVRKAELDRQVLASGYFSSKQQQELERLMENRENKESDNDYEEEEEEEEEEKETEEEKKNVFVSLGGSTEEKTETNTSESNKNKKVRVKVVEPIKEEQEENDEEDEDEDEEEDENNNNNNNNSNKKKKTHNDSESESDTHSLDEAVEAAAMLRERQRVLNENFLPDGSINEEYVRNQVRRGLRQKSNHQFNLGLHRNVQKGRQKQKIRRQIKQAMSNGFFD